MSNLLEETLTVIENLQINFDKTLQNVILHVMLYVTTTLC